MCPCTTSEINSNVLCAQNTYRQKQGSSSTAAKAGGVHSCAGPKGCQARDVMHTHVASILYYVFVYLFSVKRGTATSGQPGALRYAILTYARKTGGEGAGKANVQCHRTVHLQTSSMCSWTVSRPEHESAWSYSWHEHSDKRQGYKRAKHLYLNEHSRCSSRSSFWLLRCSNAHTLEAQNRVAQASSSDCSNSASTWRKLILKIEGSVPHGSQLVAWGDLWKHVEHDRL